MAYWSTCSMCWPTDALRLSSTSNVRSGYCERKRSMISLPMPWVKSVNVPDWPQNTSLPESLTGLAGGGPARPPSGLQAAAMAPLPKATRPPTPTRRTICRRVVFIWLPQALPKVEAGGGGKGVPPPPLGKGDDLLGCRQRRQGVEAPHCLLDTEIGGGQHVWPAERKHQEH